MSHNDTIYLRSNNVFLYTRRHSTVRVVLVFLDWEEVGGTPAGWASRCAANSIPYFNTKTRQDRNLFRNRVNNKFNKNRPNGGPNRNG